MAATNTPGSNKKDPDSTEPAAPEATEAEGDEEQSATPIGWGARFAALRASRSLMIIALVVIALGGGGGYWLLSGDGQDALPPEPVIELRRFRASPSEYVEIAPLIAPVRTGEGSPENVGFMITLELDADGDWDERVLVLMPRLRDAYLHALHVPPLDGRDGSVEEVVKDMKSRLLAASEQVLGAKAVRAVLIRDIR